jgi:hypothetical protein
MLATHWCAGCTADREFASFDCFDHEVDCVELVCVTCGAGIEFVAVQARQDPVEVSLRRAS